MKKLLATLTITPLALTACGTLNAPASGVQTPPVTDNQEKPQKELTQKETRDLSISEIDNYLSYTHYYTRAMSQIADEQVGIPTLEGVAKQCSSDRISTETFIDLKTKEEFKYNEVNHRAQNEFEIKFSDDRDGLRFDSWSSDADVNERGFKELHAKDQKKRIISFDGELVHDKKLNNLGSWVDETTTNKSLFNDYGCEKRLFMTDMYMSYIHNAIDEKVDIAHFSRVVDGDKTHYAIQFNDKSKDYDADANRFSLTFNNKTKLIIEDSFAYEPRSWTEAQFEYGEYKYVARFEEKFTFNIA